MSPPRARSPRPESTPDTPVESATTPAASPAPASVAGFETALKELEDIVARMERGDLPLEASLTLFERGMTLGHDCRSALDAAELRVRNLLEANAADDDDEDFEEGDDADELAID